MDTHPLNFMGIPEEFSNYNAAAAVLFPIPFDGACSWQRGASKGPEAIIRASTNLELYDIETQSEPYRRGIYTAPALEVRSADQMMQDGYTHTKRFLEDGKFVITLGGDHSIPYGAIRAHAERFSDLTLLHIDAHLDRREEYEGNRFSHASIIQRTKEMVHRTVSVGIRTADTSELVDLPEGDVFWGDKLVTDHQWASKVMSRLGRQVYITFDVDVFDPSIMPSTGTPEPGGVLWYDMMRFLRTVCTERHVVGMDVVELLPGPNPAPDFMIAKMIYKVLAYQALPRSVAGE